MATGVYPFANPAIPYNQAAQQATRMQLQHALEIPQESRITSPEVLAALITALAIN